MGMTRREWKGMKTLHFAISHPQQAIKPIRTGSTYTIGRQTGIGDKVTPTLETFVLVIRFSVVFDSKRLPFLVSLLVIKCKKLLFYNNM